MNSHSSEKPRVSATRRQDMLARREEILTARPDIRMASELAPLLGDLQGEYWDWQLERYLKHGSEGEEGSR